MRLALACTDAVLSITATAADVTLELTRQSMALWLGPFWQSAAGLRDRSGRVPLRPSHEESQAPRSWYRHPAQPDLFDPISWGRACAWSAADRSPWLGFWPFLALSPMGMAQLPVPPAALPQVWNPFAAYRSPGGHAVVHIQVSAMLPYDGREAWAALYSLPAFAPWLAHRLH
jgi:hypothetical protein